MATSTTSPSHLFRARVPKKRFKDAESILGSLGLSPQDALNMLLAQVVLQRGLPFAVSEPDFSYFANEYGLDRKEMDDAGRRMTAEAAADRSSGELATVTSPDDL